MASRVTEQVVEVLTAPTPAPAAARVTQHVVEVLSVTPPPVGLTQPHMQVMA